MPNLRNTSSKPAEEGPWEGAWKWVKVEGRDDVGRVVNTRTSVGSGISSVKSLMVQFESGEILFYAPGASVLTRCDENGQTRGSSSDADEDDF